MVVTSGKPTWCNGSTLAHYARDVGLSPALATEFSIFITPMTLLAVILIMYKLCTVWLLNLRVNCMCKAIACMHVIGNM